MFVVEIRERISEFIITQSLSVRAFANICGIHQATLDKQLKGLRDVSLDTVMKIASAYPNVSAEWLLRGEGPTSRTDITNQSDDRLAKLMATIGEMQSIIEEKMQAITALQAENEKLKKQIK